MNYFSFSVLAGCKTGLTGRQTGQRRTCTILRRSKCCGNPEHLSAKTFIAISWARTFPHTTKRHAFGHLTLPIPVCRWSNFGTRVGKSNGEIGEYDSRGICWNHIRCSWYCLWDLRKPANHLGYRIRHEPATIVWACTRTVEHDMQQLHAQSWSVNQAIEYPEQRSCRTWLQLQDITLLQVPISPLLFDTGSV